MKKLNTILLATVLLCGTAIAAQTTTYRYSQYNVKFELPNAWKIQVNNASRFQATDNREITMTLSPWKDKSVETAEQVAAGAYRKYTNYTNKRILGKEEMDNDGDLEKYLYVCEGYYNGKKAIIVILGIIDVNSAVNLSADFIWWDNANSKKNLNIIGEVADSITQIN